MKITFNKKSDRFLILDEKSAIIYSCKMINEVRNEINGRRRIHYPKDVVRVVTKDRTWGPPYMPRQFPDGMANVVAVEVNANHPEASRAGYTVAKFETSEFGTVRITTDATQMVPVWMLDKDGGYEAPTGMMVPDYGYHFHFAPHSTTTLGCGRFGTQAMAEEAARIVAAELAAGRRVKVWVE